MANITDNTFNPTGLVNKDSGSGLTVSETKDTTDQYVTFSVVSDEYGVDILSIQEIKAWSDTTPLPNSPEFMRGVLNLRGLIVPIYDLKARFGMGLTDVTPMHVIIIIKVDNRFAGILVDSVSDIIEIMPSEVQPLPELETNIGYAFLKGLANIEGRMVSILDINSLFAKTAEDFAQNNAKQMLMNDTVNGEKEE